MDHTTGGASEAVESVKFRFYTDEEVRKLSVKRITSSGTMDNLDKPIPNGLYDLAMGSLLDSVSTTCLSCGNFGLLCPGHCGHIELPLPVYNPLLFKILFQLVKRSCFFCHRFKAEKSKVQMCVDKLELIKKGDITGAKNLGLEECEGESESESDAESMEGTTHLPEERCLDSQNLELANWTCLQHKEAMSALDGLFKSATKKKCSKCKKINPKITCPSFGWFHLDMSKQSIRANVILGTELGAPSDDAESPGAEGSPSAEYTEQKNLCNRDLSPKEVNDHMKKVWEKESLICSLICDIQQQRFCTSEKKTSYSMFFINALLVAPGRFRPPLKGFSIGPKEHPQTELLVEVLKSSKFVKASLDLYKADPSSDNKSVVITSWKKLQNSVNVLYLGETAKGSKNDLAKGICQLLEKKQGMMRLNMMGKRVDFSCRSVISPDPNLAVNEIGIPLYFAKRLTYPERVTPWNAEKLAEAILSGNATGYMDNGKPFIRFTNMKSRNAFARKLLSSRGTVTQSGRSIDQAFEGKVVLRCLEDGDVVLVNRQPSLHKPSIMAHIVRVLEGEKTKTLRMHYANCSVYNADFDGDEMNVHFPQDEISRAEAYNIVNANNQYIVPTSGEPKRGLIQDHIVSAVLLTKKDTFLTRDEFHHLLYGSGVSAAVRCSSGKSRKKISLISSEDEILDTPPAIWKPEPLWTGKQVITSILNHMTRTRGLTPLTVERSVKIPNNYFDEDSKEEGKLRIQKNELVHGMHGFTCGIDDLLVTPTADKERMEKLGESETKGEKVHSLFVGSSDGDIGSIMLQAEIEKTIRTTGDTAITRLDRMMSNSLNGITSEVNDKLFPKGLQKPFPKNCLSVMTISGAKGSTVNFSQISSLLGQQELEGKRVPRMVSGKTLPCFHPWDPASRAGGFIGDRFLTGLRPQEYYFHCMAGREGLVDTTVKTSVSGYLQRCLIKSLECLKICYDLTVRDADGSVVQFCYGEDGVDAHKTSFISEFKIIAENQKAVTEKIVGEFDDSQLLKCGDYVKDMPAALKGKTHDFISTFKKSEKRDSLKRKDFLKLMKLKYFSSLAQPGEPVGVIAAQSIGEPSTQMTLNTFHHAGRGDMNVTLGVPRLKEILMRASKKISSPAMICPLQKEKTEYIAHQLAAASKDIITVGNVVNSNEVQSLAMKFKKVTVADIIESMEVHVVPYSNDNGQFSTLYKLKIKVHQPDDFPPYVDIKRKECMQALDVLFVRELENLIQSHMKLLSKISGIDYLEGGEFEFASAKAIDEDGSGETSQQVGEDIDRNGEDNDDYEAEDLDGDAQKRKQQATDEVDYEEDDMEPEASMSEIVDTEMDDMEPDEMDYDDDVMKPEGSVAENVGTDSDEGDDHSKDGEAKTSDAEVAKKPKKKKKSKRDEKESEPEASPRKAFDRKCFSKIDNLNYEVHFKFSINDPHILLAEIAKKAAKNVYIRRPGTIQKCSAFEYKDPISEYEKGYQGEPALQTVGVDFKAFWNLQDDLDVNRIISNDIQAVLQTYGVEAARATLLNEVKGVFKAYSIAVDIRHLSLVADYMTQEGGLRPLSRHGAAAGSTSPFSKMSFETAGKFLVDAAYHGEVDNLESPSARICLGLPVKMGTGSFDVLQQVF